MFMRKNFKLVVMALVVMIMLGLMSTVVSASNPPVLVSNDKTTTGTTTTGTTTTGTTTGTSTTSTKTETTTSTTNLPKAGLDYSVLFIITGCVVIGAYAFTRIKSNSDIQ